MCRLCKVYYKSFKTANIDKYKFHTDNNYMSYINAYLLIYTAVIMIIMLTGNLRSFQAGDRSTKVFYGMLISDIIMLLSGGLDSCLLAGIAGMTGGGCTHAVLAGISDLSYFMVLAFFIVYIDIYARNDEYRVSVIARAGAFISFIYGIFWFVSDFLEVIYVQDSEGIVHGSLYILGQVGGYVTGLLSIMIAIRRWKSFTKSEKTGIILFIIVPLIGSFLKGIFSGILVMPLLVSLSIIIIQSFIQSARELLLRQQETELARMQNDLLMSRMKPHFIYNVLNTIYALCDSSVGQAKEAIARFSRYLRQSLVDIDSHRLISFDDELAHVENYLAIEKMRFGRNLNIQYDIEERDFMIPPLTLQAIVGNAVRHGVEKKPEGGEVRISSRKDGDEYVITVKDTGAGFDADEVKLTGIKTDENGRKHIGLYSAAYRVESLCKGSLDIESVQGEGTTVTIRLKGGER